MRLRDEVEVKLRERWLDWLEEGGSGVGHVAGEENFFQGVPGIQVPTIHPLASQKHPSQTIH